MNKTRFIILFAVIIVLVIVGGLYYRGVFTAQNTGSPNGSTGSLPASGLPMAQNGGVPNSAGQNNASNPATSLSSTSATFGLVADVPALSYFVDSNNITTIVSPDAHITRIRQGVATVISSSTVFGLRTAAFSYDGRFILREYAASQTATAVFSIFDTLTQKETSIPSTLEAPTWSPNSNQLLFISQTDSGKVLAVLNFSEKNLKAKRLLAFNFDGVRLAWIRPTTILIEEKPSSAIKTSLWILSLSSKTLTPLQTEERGLTSLWDPQNPRGLIFKSDDRGVGGGLFLAAEKINSGLIPFPFLTLPSKCVFPPAPLHAATSTISKTLPAASSTAPQSAPPSFSSLYCLIPRDRSLLDTSPLPDLYLQRGFFTTDAIFTIDPANGQTTLLHTPAEPLDGTEIKLFGKTLFMINRLDNRLYALSL